MNFKMPIIAGTRITSHERRSFIEDFEAETTLLSNGYTRSWNQNPAIIFEVKANEGFVELQYIENTGRRRCGDASTALDWFCELADKYAVVLMLMAWKTGDGNYRLETNELRAWYARHGFERYAQGALVLVRMHRQPIQPLEPRNYGATGQERRCER